MRLREQILLTLQIWRKDRGISLNYERKDLVANLNEELTEFMRAQNEEEEVDAICDIIVFTLNAGGTFNAYDTCNFNKDRFIVEMFSFFTGLLQNTDEVVTQQIRDKIIHRCMCCLMSSGYDPFLCILETVKEISSRTGKWNAEIGKWLKDTSPEAKAKWYKANYKEAKNASKKL